MLYIYLYIYIYIYITFYSSIYLLLFSLEIVRHDNTKESKASGPAYHRAPPASTLRQKPSLLTNTTIPQPPFNVGKHAPMTGKVRVRQSKETARKPFFWRKQKSTAKDVSWLTIPQNIFTKLIG